MGKRHFYAKYDWFQMGSKEPGNGFVNSKGLKLNSLEGNDYLTLKYYD